MPVGISVPPGFPARGYYQGVAPRVHAQVLLLQEEVPHCGLCGARLQVGLIPHSRTVGTYLLFNNMSCANLQYRDPSSSSFVSSFKSGSEIIVDLTERNFIPVFQN